MNGESGDGLDGLRFTRVLIWIVYAFVLVVVAILALAFFFKLTDANPSAGFVEAMYSASDTFASPFREIWAATESSGGSVFDWSLLFAIAMYAVLAALIHAGIAAIDRRIVRTKREQWAAQQQELERERIQASTAQQPAPTREQPPGPPPPPPPTAGY